MDLINHIIEKLVLNYKLVDEIVVIDGGSNDSTVEKASQISMVKFIDKDDILSKFCKFKGKGEALWKSLCVTSGDIILYCDSDIKNFDERFIVGQLGPLFKN